jgi:hypothetical protein
MGAASAPPPAHLGGDHLLMPTSPLGVGSIGPEALVEPTSYNSIYHLHR